MVRIRTINDLILSTIDFYRLSQPLLDTKPGTVARDILVDAPSTQAARLYEELARIRTAQSLRLSVGSDLDKLSSNVGATRKQGSKSSGTALISFNELDADIPINAGDIINANNGASFQVTTSLTVAVNNANEFRATASKFRADLDFVGITDEFAVEVPAECTVTGTIGNVSRYSLISTTIDGVSNVTNAAPFSGGSKSETDSEFRNRVLAVFSGANTGTELGYRNAVLADPQVIDALVVGPGDDLMTRDGTQVFEAEDGTRTITSEGTGGKVDIYVFGNRLTEILDSYIYRDQSNKNDPTDPANDFVLGQIEGDEDKTVTTRRLENIEAGTTPNQPAFDIIEVSGSSSGANFAIKTVDDLGRIFGNYELVPDTGNYGGSPWGFDKIRWIDNRIRDFTEDSSKGSFNGQDVMAFSDVSQISASTQSIQIVNENSNVSASDRSSVQLQHPPLTSVTRVFNLTTGERYVVSNQNPDGDGSINTTGRITITGNTLPAVSDTLQVDYTWLFSYDPNFDFDNRETSDNPRTVTDSTDWGYSNAVRREESTVQTSGTQKTVTVTHPITSVINVNTFVAESSTVTLVSNRLAVIVLTAVENVISVARVDGAELYDTSRDDGSFSGLTIFLPTDTIAEIGDVVSVRFNSEDVYTVNGVSGSFDSNLITLSTSSGVSSGTVVECNYIANVRQLLPTTLLPSLPAVRNGNGFDTTTATAVGVQPTTHIFSSPGVIEQNLRQAPTRLKLSIAGSISVGVITVSGTSFEGIFDGVFTVSTPGLTHNLAGLIRDALDIASNQPVPSSVGVVRLISAEKVTTSTSLEVLSVDHTYDIKGYEVRNNNFVKSEAVSNSTLSATEIQLPSTVDNETNAPELGDRMRVTFYIGTTDDTENVSFSKSGSLFTDKIFALVDTIAISSGFTSGASQSATLTVSAQNQPSQGSRYSVTYDYLAPKTNERINIRYNNNSVINDAVFSIEEVRPIGSDVLPKTAEPLLINTTQHIVVTGAYENSSTLVAQNVRDALTSALNASSLATTVDESDLINVAYTVQGVDRVRSTRFNLAGEIGRVLSISARENEYLQANEVEVIIEER
jgi:hypothetical protein